MIKISYKKQDKVNSIIIEGHALYSVSGKDIVCASVSSIVITSINAMLLVDKEAIKYEKKEGYVKLDIIKHTDMIDLLLTNLINLLEELEQDYKKYIKIN